MPPAPANEDQSKEDTVAGAQNTTAEADASFIDLNEQRIRVVCRRRSLNTNRCDN